MSDAPDPRHPSPTPTSTPYWDALRRDIVTIQRCDSCATWIFYPRSHCPSCLRPEPAWHEVSGAGTIHSFTVARQPTSSLFDGEPPIVLAIVALDEGPHMTSSIVGADPSEVAVGARVTAVFDHTDGGHVLLRHRLDTRP